MALVHAEVVAAVRDEHVELFERSLVEQHLDTLAGRVLALAVLCVDPFLTAAHAGFLAVFDERVYLVLNFTHDCSMI